MPVLEKTLISTILSYLKSLPSCFCWKEHGGMYGTAGLPDILCCIAGRFVAFEVKTETGKVTGLQKKTLRQIQNAGGAAFVVRSLDEVKAILRNLEEISRWLWREDAKK